MPHLALTFDDGPDEQWTPRLLDALRNCDARATFFPIAARAVAAPQLIRRMLHEGHTVGLHCHEHIRHTSRGVGWLRRDTATALAVLADCGAEARLWRTPWGRTAPWSAGVASEHELEIVGWTVDTHDWRGDGAEEMFELTRPGLVAGAVVLAHDGIGPGARRRGARETVRYVELVARHAAEHDLGLCALGPGGVR